MIYDSILFSEVVFLTVEELIEKLSRIEDKSMEVHYLDDAYIDGYVINRVNGVREVVVDGEDLCVIDSRE